MLTQRVITVLRLVEDGVLSVGAVFRARYRRGPKRNLVIVSLSLFVGGSGELAMQPALLSSVAKETLDVQVTGFVDGLVAVGRRGMAWDIEGPLGTSLLGMHPVILMVTHEHLEATTKVRLVSVVVMFICLGIDNDRLRFDAIGRRTGGRRARRAAAAVACGRGGVSGANAGAIARSDALSSRHAVLHAGVCREDIITGSRHSPGRCWGWCAVAVWFGERFGWGVASLEAECGVW